MPEQPIQINDKGEARHRLEDRREDGWDGADETRRARGSHRRNIREARDAAHLGLHADAAPGQFAADYTALITARAALSVQLGELDEAIRRARRLARPMNDGHGPIALAMSTTFAATATDTAGAVRALEGYRAELQNVIDAIQRTMEQYEVMDATLAQQMNAIGSQHG